MGFHCKMYGIMVGTLFFLNLNFEYTIIIIGSNYHLTKISMFYV